MKFRAPGRREMDGHELSADRMVDGFMPVIRGDTLGTKACCCCSGGPDAYGGFYGSSMKNHAASLVEALLNRAAALIQLQMATTDILRKPGCGTQVLLFILVNGYTSQVIIQAKILKGIYQYSDRIFQRTFLTNYEELLEKHEFGESILDQRPACVLEEKVQTALWSMWQESQGNSELILISIKISSFSTRFDSFLKKLLKTDSIHDSIFDRMGTVKRKRQDLLLFIDPYATSFFIGAMAAV
ncbi:hypothetical protein E5288_WYG011956 [Bos mutus]|uniref:Uncharacterized protein n=1 Tax=Bos mutus TaxID=72004 RepID=A0A6B0QY77_9CETA|nr:hypothetical protein [Bos mutus]